MERPSKFCFKFSSTTNPVTENFVFLIQLTTEANRCYLINNKLEKEFKVMIKPGMIHEEIIEI